MSKTISNLRAFREVKGRRNVVFKLGGEFSPYGSAFYRAGHSLAENFLKGRASARDSLPLVYIYRHALELHLKAIVIAGNLLMEPAGRALSEKELKKLVTGGRGHGSGHSMSRLLARVEVVFRFAGYPQEVPDDYAPIKNFNDIRSLVEDIEKFDPGSFAFRYPTDRDLIRRPLEEFSHSVPGKEEIFGHHFAFNMPEFLKVMEPLVKLLGDSALDLEERTKIEHEEP